MTSTLPASSASGSDTAAFGTVLPDDVGVDDVEDVLSEQQLREIYDNEEIERFLNLFSAYVTEVRLPDSPPPPHIRGSLGKTTNNQENQDEANYAEDGDWVPVDGSLDAQSNVSNQARPTSRCLSEEIAFRYIIPALPPAQLSSPSFTIGRLRLTTQRLYLSIEPAYVPFFKKLIELATWENQKKSSLYCTVFWILWYQNLLLPSIFFRILYSLLRRRLFRYPTLTDLRRHRREIIRANEFGEEVQSRLAASSSFGMKEAWRLFKLFSKSKKNKTSSIVKDKVKEERVSKQLEGDDNITSVEEDKEVFESATVLDDVKDGKEEKDVKRAILSALSEIADLHERVKNLFMWRQPASSRMYGSIIFFLFLITLLLPAKYLAKLTYGVGGFFFWHITPIIAALTLADRARLPPAFGDVPTDADYAMEVISKRVAAGLDVRPPRRQKATKQKDGQVTIITDAEILNQDSGIKQSEDNNKDRDNKSVDWKKWGERVAFGKALADDGKRLITKGQWPQTSPRLPRDYNVPVTASTAGQPEGLVETHTFPAQHSTALGLITLTQTTFFFTPLTSTIAKIAIPIHELRGVKKTGMFKGMLLRWADASGEMVEKEEKFKWVGGRDELFARLIGRDGKRWVKV